MLSAHRFDIAIAGGGVIGLTLARALAARHARVAVIDAGAEIPPATNAAAGMLAPSFEDAVGDPEALYKLSADSLRQWPSFAAGLEEETGLSVDFRDDGVIGVAFDETEAKALEERCAGLAARGAAVAMLSPEETRRLEPALAPDVAAGFFAEADAQVDPRKLLAALRESLARRAAVLIDGRALKAQPQNGVWCIALASGEAVEAATLVIASGAVAAALVCGLPKPPVFPVKGEALALDGVEGEIRRVVRGPGAYLCPKAGGRLVIGATELADRGDLHVDDAAVDGLLRRARRTAPAIEAWPELERWAGLRPGTPDGAPILGCDPRGPEGVYLALGHYRNGVLLAPASAELLAADIFDGEPLTNARAFLPSRFDAAPD